MIKVDEGRLHPAVLGNPKQAVQQGDLVFAFGSPFDFRFSMSQGVVSGKGRSVGVIRGRAGYENFIQVDAAINPGNSGGPLTNYQGQVIGMNTAIATGPRGDRGSSEGQFAGIGLAIPLKMIVPVVNQLIDDGVVRKGYLGLVPGNISQSWAAELQRRGFIGRGVRVRSVEPGSPASRGGLQQDDIITHISDEQVSSNDQLRSVISSTLPGETIEIRVWRYDNNLGKGENLTLSVRLEQLSMLRVLGRVPDDQPLDRLEEAGLARLSTASERLARQFDVDYTPGVIVRKLTDDSRYDSDMPPGSVITEVGGTTVATVGEFFTELRKYNLLARNFRNGGVRLTVIRPDGTVGNPLLFVED